MVVLADGPGLVGQEPAEVGGGPLEGEHGHQPVDGGDVGQVPPLPEGVGLAQALADPADHHTEVRGGHAGSPFGDPLQRTARGPARGEEHGQLFGDDGKLG